MLDAGSVVIRESTHPFSSFSIQRTLVGRRRSLLRSALGRAILAAAGSDLRRDTLETLAGWLGGPGRAAMAQDRGLVERLVSQVQRDGHASSVGGTEANISAIALPVLGRGCVVGSLNSVFFRKAMTPQPAAGRHLDSLRGAVAAIESRLSSPAASGTTLNHLPGAP